MSTLPPRKRAWFVMVTLLLTGTFAVTLFAVADVYAHHRTQDVAGVNVWGYRGAPVSRKRAGQIRVVMLGGSTVFGWGLPADESIPAFLERRLNATVPAKFSVVNLGAPGQGAYGFAFDLKDFEALDYDIVCLYEGYNDVGPYTQRGINNYLLWRRGSPIFRWIGYYPILPVVLGEKAQAIMSGGSTAVPPGTVRFDATLARRTAAGAIGTVAGLTAGLSSNSGALSPIPSTPAVDDECIPTWRRYCGSVRDAIDWALARGKRVIFVTQPYISDAHIEQQANVAAMLQARYANEQRVRYLNLGRLIDLRDQRVAYDGLHLVASGNDTIAAKLVDPVLAAAGLSR